MLAEIKLFHKREHKALLRRLRGVPRLIAASLAEYEYPSEEQSRPSIAPPSVTALSPNKPGGVGGFLHRIFNRKV